MIAAKGMDKILQSMTMKGEITITNDGATILKSIHIDNAAAKVLVEISKTQDDEVGDGTTSVVVLAGELLREAQKLMDKREYKKKVGILMEDIDYLKTQIKYYGADTLDDLQIKYEYQVELNVKQGQLYKINQDWFTIEKYRNKVAPLVLNKRDKYKDWNFEGSYEPNDDLKEEFYKKVGL